MVTVDLAFGFSTPDVAATVAALRALGWIRKRPPPALRIVTEGVPVGADWLERSIQSGYATAMWEDSVTRLVIRDRVVCGKIASVELEVARILGLLETVPFTVASFGSVHHWGDYFGPSFSDHHGPHGWGVAFRGDGHERMVSRRWLATGPWRVLKGNDDITLVQFHDLAASTDLALEQAKPAHLDMGIHKQGGFLQTSYVYRTELRGLHSKQQKALIFVVKGRSVSTFEMRDAAAARRFQPFGPDHPIEKVVYVFIDPAEAEQHLPLLWRYGHEVRLISDDGIERRIDEGYEPVLEKPAWVEALGRDDARELLR